MLTILLEIDPFVAPACQKQLRLNQSTSYSLLSKALVSIAYLYKVLNT